MQDIFDQEDREINGFNDITGYEDFAILRRFEDIEDLPEEISMCWGNVLVLCSSMGILRERQSEDHDELWTMYQEFYRRVLPKEMFEKNIVRSL